MKLFILSFFFFLVFLLSFFVSGVVESTDGLQYLAVARNIYYGKGPTSPPYEYNTRQNIHMNTRIAENGNSYSFTGLGFSYAMVPFVAIADLVYKHYSVLPPVHFPLENDWVILLSASFINVFFMSAIGVILFLYLIELKLTKSQALIMTFISIFSTNLFVFSKHIMAHTMFAAFLFLSFYLLKLFSRKRHLYLIFLSGLSFGIVMITYNLTFLLAVPAYLIYYLMLIKPIINFSNFKKIIRDIFIFSIGTFPFVFTYVMFENLRSTPASNFASPKIISDFSSAVVQNRSLAVYMEGLFGQLFSPGRSIFIYTPILVLLVTFWHKIKKSFFPEFFLYLTYLGTLVIFYSVTYSVHGADISALWHGESSWGPRYLMVTIPFAMLTVSGIFINLSKKMKLFVFLPLVLVGLYVEVLGIIMPYQIKYHELQSEFMLNQTNYTVYLYTNLLPRYNPVYMMSKKLYKLIDIYPKTKDHGIYNVKFYDGISFPFNVGLERWRAAEESGYISFDNTNEIETISFDLINHPISTTKADAKVNFILNGKQLFKKPVVLKISERKQFELPINKSLLKPKNNELIITIDYDGKPIFKNNDQIFGILAMFINGERVNLESIDVPAVSPLGPKMTGAVYKNWGGSNKDPWKVWDIHSQTFERLPDIWWIRNLYYWDVPKRWIFALLGLNITGFVVFSLLTKNYFQKLKNVK